MASIDQQMSKIFTQAQSQMLDEFLLALEQGKNITVIQARLNAIITELTTQYNSFQTVTSQEEYLLGGKYYNKDIQQKLKEIQKKAISERITLGAGAVTDLGAVHTQAVNNLIVAGNNYLEETLQGIRKGILGQFNEYQTLLTFESVGQGVIQGSTLTEMKNNFIANIKDSFPYFKDKAGRKRTLERYGEMLIRTETSKAYNTGTLTQGVEAGVEKFRRNELGDACPICIPHRGEIWDIKKQGFPTLLYHPNCRGIREPIL